MKELNDAECPADSDLTALFSNPPTRECLNIYVPVLKIIGDGDKILVKSAELAYQSWLYFYSSNMSRIGKVTKAELVAMANYFARLTGLRHQPILLKKVVRKLGLTNVPGLIATDHLDRS